MFIFLLKNKVGPAILDNKAKIFCNAEAKQLIKENLINGEFTDGKNGRRLFSIDVAEIYDDPDVLKFLKEKASNYEEWQRLNSAGWFALLILAQHGDEQSIKKVIQIAKIPVKDRVAQIYDMIGQLSYVRRTEIVDLLREFLASNETQMSYDGSVISASNTAAMSLSSMIKDYPKVDSWGRFYDDLKPKCIEWFNTHKSYEFKEGMSYNVYIAFRF